MRANSTIAGRGGFLSRLRRDQGGNTLAIVAGALIPLTAMIGGAVDLSRGYMVKTRLQQACDSGVLAGRKAVGGSGTYNAAALAQANNFFNTNYEGGWQSSKNLSFTTGSPDNGTTVNGTASVRLPTVLMYIFGRDNIDLTVTCSAALQASNADITMVLDTTGSMASNISDGAGGTTTRIAGLRAAMKNFYGILAAAQASSNSRTRYAFVPYTGTVNVGQLIRARNSAWLNPVDSYQSRVAIHYTTSSRVYFGTRPAGSGTSEYFFDNNAERPICEKYSGNYWNSDNTIYTSSVINLQKVTKDSTGRDFKCKVTETTTTYLEWQDHPNPTTSNFAGWRYRKVDFPNLATFLSGGNVSVRNGDNGVPVNYSWSGCIEERPSVASGAIAFDNGAITPTGVKDLNIDTAPTNTSDGWRPYFDQISYYRYANGNLTTDDVYNGYKAQTTCPKQAQLLSSMTKTQFDTYADGLIANGGTYHDIGAIWGGRLSSPDGIFAANVNEVPVNNGFVSRNMIFMTDGEMAPGITYHSAYGLEYWDRRVTSDGYSDQLARHNQRFRAVCESIKAKGIRVWVIAFATDLSPDLTGCASANSAYVSANASQLDTAFANIANTIADLRLTQ